MKSLSERQIVVLQRLAEANENYVSFSGHSRSAAAQLEKRGFAEFFGPDKWTSGIYKITEAGRKAAKK